MFWSGTTGIDFPCSISIPSLGLSLEDNFITIEKLGLRGTSSRELSSVMDSASYLQLPV